MQQQWVQDLFDVVYNEPGGIWAEPVKAGSCTLNPSDVLTLNLLALNP